MLRAEPSSLVSAESREPSVSSAESVQAITIVERIGRKQAEKIP